MELIHQPIHELTKLIKKKEISSFELTQAFFEQINKIESKVNAFLSLNKEDALIKAKEIDEKNIFQQNISPLCGIPIAIKDNICIKNYPTTCASKILQGFIAPYDATVIKKLKATGAVIIGKTNLDEFAMGSSTENSAIKITCNPWNLETVPGGSSGGSAACVSSSESAAAIGSDTGGSIRQPASFCGVVGLKPTYGRVSRFGLVAFASSLDQIGPLTKDVSDCALVFNSIYGYDPYDSTSINLKEEDFNQALINDIKGLKIGVVSELLSGEGIEKDIKTAILKSLEKFAELGAHIEDISLPSFEYSLPTYYIIAPAEASANLARYDGVKYGFRYPKSENLVDMYKKTRSAGFGQEVKRRIMIGTYVLSAGYYDAYYLKAQKVRTLIRQDFERAFKKFDVLITPTSPTVAFKIGEKADNPLAMYLSDIATIPINLAGVPAISIPCGFSKNLPIGLQIISKPFDEKTLFRTAFAYEQNTSWHMKKPKLTS
jgi:aspartyl-tRNA(Asn)/glutamyl-tRNA(Gln) amidotransferase subunit A